MRQMKRYALYYAPRPGAFADFAAAWLGWDAAKGQPAAHPDLGELPVPIAELTAEPRKYGFHGTLRAPFRLADGLEPATLATKVEGLAQRLPPVVCQDLVLQDLHGFVALIPRGNDQGVRALAQEVVRVSNAWRAPLTPAEIARRRPETLTARQRDLLIEWGYPFVMEAFQFHLTLTGKLDPDIAATVRTVLEQTLAPLLPLPFAIEDLCLFGEDAEGRCHLLHRYPLLG